MKALNSYVLIKHVVEEKTNGTLIVESRNDTEKKGEVVSVGLNVINVAIGDIVWFKKYDLVIEKDGDKFLAIVESDIVAVD